uniref:Integrase catalytic domain-containing protein n=1 Tax=Tanacetum cinerariifolium TaxID=118510 RepID=A0A6L2L564_TANCI|nr:hypothetical protein [Tanacetum cinerariifolium]
MQKRRNDVKAKTTLLLALPDEHQLRFSKYETPQELWEAILKTFGGNEATKKIKKNQLKQQYGNFKAEGSKILEQTFNRMQAIVSHLEFIDVEIEQNDLNQKFLTSLAPEWLIGKGKVHTASTQVSNASTDVAAASLSHDTADMFWKKTDKKITIQGSDVAGFDKSKEENYALVADDEVPTEFSLMAKSSSSSENEEVKDQIRTRRVLDIMLSPSPAQVYSPPKKDLSWTGLPEFVDDIVTEYSRPTPSIDTSKSDTSDLQSSNFFISGLGELSGSIMSKPMIKFVKTANCHGVIKTNKIKTARKSPVKYVEMYKNTSKSPKVMGNQCNWNNLKSQQLGKDFLMQNKACFKCGYFDHLASNCGVWVDKGETWPKNNFAHKNVTPRDVLLKTGKTPISRPNMNVAQPKMTSFTKTTHLNVTRPFQRKSAVKTQSRVPRVSTVTGKIPTVDSKFFTAKSTFTADLRNKGKAGNSHNNINDKGYWDSGCSRYMTGNISYLSEYEPYDGGYVSFGQGGGKFTGKGIIKTGKLEFENVYFVKELKYNMFSMSQICDNKNSVLFTDSECIVLGKDFKLKDDTNVLLRTPRQRNMYSIDLNNIVPHKNLTCLVAKASADESMLWHRRLGHLNIKTMNKLVKNNLVKGLPSKCFENDHTCVACLKGKQHKASCKTKLVNSVSKALHTLHMDLFGPTFVSSLNHKWYCLVVTDDFSRCDNGGEFKNKEMNEFYTKKGIRREFSNDRTPQQNRVAERRNMTLIKAAMTMLADAKLPAIFWAEAVNTACYVQNRVLVNKSQNKTPYELFNSKTPAIGFLRPFGCHVMILNTLEHLGKFDAKGDEGYIVGYSMSSKAFRVFNKRTKKVEENLHVDFLENKLIEKRAGPNWLFDIDTLTNSMNYVPVVVAGTSSTNILGTKDVASQAVKKDVSSLRYISLPNWFHEAHMESFNIDAQDDCNADVPESSGISNPTATSKVLPADQIESLTVESKIPTVSSSVLTVCLDNSPESSSGLRLISKGVFSHEETLSLGNALTLSNWFEDTFGDTTNAVDSNDLEADLSNIESSIPASPTPTFRIHKDHPNSQIIGPVDTHVKTRNKSKETEEHSFIATIHHKTNLNLLQFCLFSCFLSQEEPKNIFDALKDPRVRPIGTKWVLKNKKDERGIVIRNKARLVAQGYTQEKGIEYEEVFAPVVRIEAIRLFLAYASFMGFIVKQMDVKSAFLYGTIDEEVYVMQPPRFQDPKFPDRVYKVEKAMYGLHQAPRAWYDTLSKYLLDNGFQKGIIDHTPFIRKHKREFLLVQVPDIMFAVCACARHQVTPKECHLLAVKRIFRYLKDDNGADLLTKPFDAGRFQYLVGEGSATPTEPHHTPSPQKQHSPHHDPSSPSHPTATTEPIPQTPTETPTFKRYTGRAIWIAQSKALSPVADELASLLRDDRQGEAFPIVSSLDAGQDRENITKTSALPHESSPWVTSLDADEGSMQQKLQELMELCTSLQRQQTQMDSKLKDQDLEISGLTARVKFLKDKDRGSAEPTQEDAPIKRGIMETGEEVRADKSTELRSNDTDEMVNVLSSMEAANILTSEVAAVSVSPVAGVLTVGVLTVSGLLPIASVIFTTASMVTPYTRRPRGITIEGAQQMRSPIIGAKDKGKQKVVESKVPKKRKIQEQIDTQVAREMEEEFSRENKRGLTLEEIKEKFIPVWKQLEDFVPMNDVASIFGRSVKHPIIDWEIHSEEKREYLKIIRLGGHTAVYQFFINMLKQFDREDLHQLWTLVNETLSIKLATKDKEKELWVELKRLFEPDFEDPLWTRNQALMHDPLEWKLYDTCGVHHVFTKDE